MTANGKILVGDATGLPTLTLAVGDLDIEDYEVSIQTDAAISPGNSGGALINTARPASRGGAAGQNRGETTTLVVVEPR